MYAPSHQSVRPGSEHGMHPDSNALLIMTASAGSRTCPGSVGLSSGSRQATIHRNAQQSLTISGTFPQSVYPCKQSSSVQLMHVDGHTREGDIGEARNISQMSHLNIPSSQVAILRSSQQSFIEVCELYSGDAARFVRLQFSHRSGILVSDVLLYPARTVSSQYRNAFDPVRSQQLGSAVPTAAPNQTGRRFM